MSGFHFERPVHVDGTNTQRCMPEQSNLAIVNDPSVFVLTPAQMSANGYTLPSYVELPPETSTDSVDEATNWVRLSPKRDESWVETPQAPLLDLNGKPPKQKVWALDCEMVSVLVSVP